MIQVDQQPQAATAAMQDMHPSVTRQPFVPPTLTKHGYVATVTQQKNPGGPLFPFEQIVAEVSP